MLALYLINSLTAIIQNSNTNEFEDKFRQNNASLAYSIVHDMEKYPPHTYWN